MPEKKSKELHDILGTESDSFDHLISPHSRDTFLSRSWGKSFLHIAGHKTKFQALLPWKQLNNILEQYHLQPPRLRLYRDGKPIEASRFMGSNKERSALKPSALVNCLSEGATLILDNVDELAPAVSSFCETIQEALSSPTIANLYASWRTQKGFDLHWDEQDTFILQLSGRKQWKVYSPTRLHPLRDDVTPPTPTGDPYWEGVLEEGGLLYLPRGWWHVAFPLNEPSLHLTVTVTPANGTDLLRWMIEQMKDHEEIRMNVPLVAGHAEQEQYVDRTRELLMAAWPKDVLERFMAHWESRIPLRPHIRLPHAPREAQTPLAMETNVRLASSRRVAFLTPSSNGNFSFVSGGFKGECDADLVPALKQLSGKISRTVNELCEYLPSKTDSAKLMILLTAMAMRGVIEVTRASQEQDLPT